MLPTVVVMQREVDLHERRVGDSAMQQHRQRLAVTIREFMGDDILQEVAKTPAWKNGRLANRERVVRKERRLEK
jgi:hypothetical protein